MTLKTILLNIVRSCFKIPFLENWLRKKTFNTTSNSFFYKMTPNNYQYAKNSYREFNYKGVELRVDIRDYVGHYLYFGFKDEAHEKLLALAKPNFIVLDIGTNIGSTLLQFANKIGENGRVYGFEPDPINFKACKENIKLNTFNNLKVENIGLGDEKGSFNLVVDTETNRGGNRIELKTQDKNTTTIKVECLDDWIIKNKIKKIDLIKIDVEGFETNVVKGGLTILKKMHPILFIEVDDNNLKKVESSAKELIALIEELGYDITNANDNSKVSSKDNFTNCHFDIICKAKNK